MCRGKGTTTMAKIDCSVTVNFLKEWRRMCLAEHAKCRDKCPFGICENGEGLSCDVFVRKFPMTAVEIVQAWSDEHPVKTRLDDLLEKYPDVVVESNGCPVFYPAALGYCNNCDICRYGDGDTHRLCWDEPVDGGATGKAVE